MPVKAALESAIFDPYFSSETKLAVAVSGGPDSMALLHALAQLCTARAITLHALTVDHGLRMQAAQEARDVARWCADQSPAISHHILRWEGTKPASAVQEEARHARYALMAEHCAAHDISKLCLAHHRGDQAETVLLRLSAGSGLDGLGAMRAAAPYSAGLTLLRPFLALPKEDLLNYCADNKIPFVNDPSNQNDRFARVRLRGSMDVLAQEGLTEKRLATTAQRLSRAAQALDDYTQQLWDCEEVKKEPNCIVFDSTSFAAAPEEISLRLVMRMIGALGYDKAYPPRMEKIEALTTALRSSAPFRTRTLGGVIFSRDDKRKEIRGCPEK
jgi:tRNA(Ile)-lysidine synthase